MEHDIKEGGHVPETEWGIRTPPQPDLEASVMSCRVGRGRDIGTGVVRNDTSVQTRRRSLREESRGTGTSLEATEEW